MSVREKQPKSQILDIIRELPDDSSYDEILRELAFHRLVERGLVDLAREDVLDTSELRRRIKTWRR